jgi:hypothetical protein
MALHCRRLFGSLDSDADGFIGRRDLRSALGDAGASVADDDLDAMLRMAEGELGVQRGVSLEGFSRILQCLGGSGGGSGPDPQQAPQPSARPSPAPLRPCTPESPTPPTPSTTSERTAPVTPTNHRRRLDLRLRLVREQ